MHETLLVSSMADTWRIHMRGCHHLQGSRTLAILHAYDSYYSCEQQPAPTAKRTWLTYGLFSTCSKKRPASLMPMYWFNTACDEASPSPARKQHISKRKRQQCTAVPVLPVCAAGHGQKRTNATYPSCTQQGTEQRPPQRRGLLAQCCKQHP